MSAIVSAIIAAVLGFFRGLLDDIRAAAAQRAAGRAEQRADDAESANEMLAESAKIDRDVRDLSDNDLDSELRDFGPDAGTGGKKP